MNPIIWVIISLVAGPILYTVWNFTWARLKNPTLGFDKNYLFSMLITMIVSILVVPYLLNNQIIPEMLIPLIVAGCLGLSYTINAIINTPLTYSMNQMKTLNPNYKTVTTVERRIIEVVGVVFLIAVVLIAGVYAAVSYSSTVSASGTITGVGLNVYADAAGTIPLTSVNWGNINPGGTGNTATATVYLKSTSNVPVTLTYTTNTYVPASVQSYLTVSWNYASGTVLAPNSITAVTLTLAASAGAPAGAFSLNIVITATSTT